MLPAAQLKEYENKNQRTSCSSKLTISLKDAAVKVH
jgi:hypothetical protein